MKSWLRVLLFTTAICTLVNTSHAEDLAAKLHLPLPPGAQIMLASQIAGSRFHGAVLNAKPYVGHWRLVLYPGGSTNIQDSDRRDLSSAYISKPEMEHINNYSSFSMLYPQAYLYNAMGADSSVGQPVTLDIYLNRANNPFTNSEINVDVRFKFNGQLFGKDMQGETSLDRKGHLRIGGEDSRTSMVCWFEDESQNYILCSTNNGVADTHTWGTIYTMHYYGFTRTGNNTTVRAAKTFSENPPTTSYEPVDKPRCAGGSATIQSMAATQLDAIFSKVVVPKAPNAYVGSWKVVVYPTPQENITPAVYTDIIMSKSYLKPVPVKDDNEVLRSAAGAYSESAKYYLFNKNGAHNNRCQTATMRIRPVSPMNPYSSGSPGLIASSNFITEQSNFLMPVTLRKDYFFTKLAMGQAVVRYIGTFLDLGDSSEYYFFDWFFSNWKALKKRAFSHLHSGGFWHNFLTCGFVVGNFNAILCRVPTNGFSGRFKYINEGQKYGYFYLGFAREGAK